MADSDTDEADAGNTPKKTKIELSVKEKEERFLAAAKLSTDYDTMVSKGRVDILQVWPHVTHVPLFRIYKMRWYIIIGMFRSL